MNENNHPKRSRNIAVTIRMTPTEYAALKQKVAASGQSQQTCILKSVLDSTITSADEIAVLQDISRTFADHTKQLRGLATNINQMAHVANGQNMLPTVNTLNRLGNEISSYRKESEDLWQSIRLFLVPKRSST